DPGSARLPLLRSSTLPLFHCEAYAHMTTWDMSLDPLLPPLPVEQSLEQGLNLAEAVRVALEALVANKLRSFLTTLGIIIGVSAVIVMVALGQGAARATQEA